MDRVLSLFFDFDEFLVAICWVTQKIVMEFEAEMDGALNSEIIGLFDLLECRYQCFAKCELKKAGVSNGWLIECCWIDTESMHDHFQSIQLQGL